MEEEARMARRGARLAGAVFPVAGGVFQVAGGASPVVGGASPVVDGAFPAAGEPIQDPDTRGEDVPTAEADITAGKLIAAAVTIATTGAMGATTEADTSVTLPTTAMDTDITILAIRADTTISGVIGTRTRGAMSIRGATEACGSAG